MAENGYSNGNRWALALDAKWLTLLLAILIQAVGAAWWASAINATVSQNTAAIKVIAGQIREHERDNGIHTPLDLKRSLAREEALKIQLEQLRDEMRHRDNEDER